MTGHRIQDGDRVRVFNDINSSEMQVRVTKGHRPGQATCYHAWEPFMYKHRKSYGTLTPNPINPLQLAGGYYHLQQMPALFAPGSTDRGTRIDIERIG